MVPEAISFEAVRERFGKRTPRRQFLFERFQIVFNLLHGSGKVKHVYMFGSFPSAFHSPNDVDLFVVMAADFTTSGLSDEVLGVFTHDICRMRYNVDVFWITEAIGQEHIEAALDVFSRNRLHEPQGVLEVTR